MSEKLELAVEEFAPVRATILGAVDSISHDLQGDTHKFRSEVTGESYLVTSFEERLGGSDLHIGREQENTRKNSEVYYPGQTHYMLDRIAAAAKARFQPHYHGVISVALLGARDADTSLFYNLRRHEEGNIYHAATRVGAITDPHEFAHIVASADFDEPVDILTGTNKAEQHRLAEEHAPLVERARTLLARDGRDNTDILSVSPFILPTRSVTYKSEEEAVTIMTNLEMEGSLIIVRKYNNVDGDTVEEAYSSTHNTEESYLSLQSLKIGDKEIAYETYSVTGAMPPETTDRLTEIFNGL